MASPVDPANLPCSPADEVGGLAYFPRMLAKIRLHAQAKLWEDLHANLGKGMDLWCCGFLHLSYEDLKARVLEGGSDAEILQWCERHGRPLNDTDKHVWRQFAAKIGLEDRASRLLTKWKTESGLADRDDITTMGHYIDVAEGRKA